MKLTQKQYPSKAGTITVVRIENRSGAWVELSSLGAGILEVGVPDRSGNLENVALRYADPADYLHDGPCMGKTPGRYANRIARGRFNIDGLDVSLAVNNGPNALHGGPEGFQNRIWNVELLDGGVRFFRTSPDGEENYPGTLEASVTYIWSDDNTLSISLEAVVDKPSVVNLTNHTYWNLDGADAGSVLGHKLKMDCSRFLPTDDTLIPTGQLLPVEGTPMDFRKHHTLGERIREDFPALLFGKGYDACWAIDNWRRGELSRGIIELHSEKSGRKLTISSTQPGAQVYTGNWLDGSPLNCSGRSYTDYEGVAIELQGFPDAPNEPGFPSQQIFPGDHYRQIIEFRFSL